MKTEKLNFLGLLILVLLMGTLNLHGIAQNKGEHPGKGFQGNNQKRVNDSVFRNTDPYLRRIPGINDEQLKKISNSRLEMDKEMIPLSNVKEEKEAHLHTLNADDNVDQNEIDKTIEEISALKTKIAKLQNKHLQNIRSILNKEQKVYFDTHPMPKPDDDKHPKGPEQKHKKAKYKPKSSDACPPSGN